jgi:hypothetical protein
MKKLTVVGKGAVGSLTVAHFLYFTDWDIEWIYDKDIPSASVGEGSNLILPNHLTETLQITNADLAKVNGTPKLGISKKRWGKKDFFHPFILSQHAIHFSAQDLQNLIYDKVKDNPRLKITSGHVDNPENLDSDFVMMCVGSPKQTNKQDFKILKNIPVNSAYVTQCDWDYSKFQYSLTDAMPNGWVFGIPLQNRISIGYMYNDTLTSLNEVKEEVKEVFKEYDLTPSDRTQTLHFESYYRKQNFTPKVVYNGNASFFLEPLEATSVAVSLYITRLAFDVWHKNLTIQEAQEFYEMRIYDIELLILLHYMAGSLYKTKFWEKAQRNSKKIIKQKFTNKTEWAKLVLDATLKNYVGDGQPLGEWNQWNYDVNIHGLGLEKEIKKLGGLL